MLQDQEGVMVLLQDGHELEGCEGPPDLQLREVTIHPAEDARVVATDEKDLVVLQFQLAALGFGQHLHRSDQDAEGLGEQGNGRMEFDIHDRIWVALGI